MKPKKGAPAQLHEGRQRRARGQREEAAAFAKFVDDTMAATGLDEPTAVAHWCAIEPDCKDEWWLGDDVRRTIERGRLIARHLKRLARHRRRVARLCTSCPDTTGPAPAIPDTGRRSERE